MKAVWKQGIGRFYECENGIYPSVTTVIGASKDKTFLEEWKKKVGEEEANRITQESLNVGTALHKLFEDHFNGEILKESETPEEKIALEMFEKSLPVAQSMIDEVVMMEGECYSDTFRVAGRFDMLCILKSGEVALIDFKNTREKKKVEWIQDYRQQLAFYTKMIKETYDVEVEKNIIFMVTRAGEVQIFDFPLKDTPRKELVALRKAFWEKYGC